jgi:hypothetical protein
LHIASNISSARSADDNPSAMNALISLWTNASAKPQHWSGFSGTFALEAAPMLVFNRMPRSFQPPTLNRKYE